jgi:ribosome-associated translation inhibitor RaiA
MRLHIEGKDTTIVPHLMGRIADWLEHLNDVYDDILEARLTLVHHGHRHEARVRLLLAGKTLYATQYGNSPDAAIGAALRHVEDALYAQRALPQHARTAMRSTQNAPPSRSSPFIEDRRIAPPRRVPLRRTTAKKPVW